VAAAILTGAVAVGYIKYTGQDHSDADPGTAAHNPSTGKKGGKKKKNSPASLTQDDKKAVPAVVVTPIVPGGFSTSSASAPLVDANVATTKSKKGKKRKKSSAGAPGTTAALAADSRDNFSETSVSVDHPASNQTANRSSIKIKRPRPTASSSSQLVKPLLQSSTSISVDTDGSWTRVESRSIRRQPQQLSNISHESHPSSGGPSADASTSDAGPATSITGGSSSPIVEGTEDEASTSHASEMANPGDQNRSIDSKSKRERPDKLRNAYFVSGILPCSSSRIVNRTADDTTRVHRPLPDEKPAVGFSWADYEDVQLDESLGGGNDADADGEDDGWGVVKSRGRSSAFFTAPLYFGSLPLLLSSVIREFVDFSDRSSPHVVLTTSNPAAPDEGSRNRHTKAKAKCRQARGSEGTASGRGGTTVSYPGQAQSRRG
jgi:hypothetical protein